METSDTDVNLSQKRVPRCGRCRNHDKNAVLKGHKTECPYKDCECSKCRLINLRKEISGKLNSIKRKEKGKNSKRNGNDAVIGDAQTPSTANVAFVRPPDFPNHRSLETVANNEVGGPSFREYFCSRSNGFSDDLLKNVNVFSGSQYSYSEQRQPFQPRQDGKDDHSHMPITPSQQLLLRDGFNEKYRFNALTPTGISNNEQIPNGNPIGKPEGFRCIWNGNKCDRSEPVRIQSSLELLSYVADAQSPQPISKSREQEGAPSVEAAYYHSRVTGTNDTSFDYQAKEQLQEDSWLSTSGPMSERMTYPLSYRDMLLDDQHLNMSLINPFHYPMSPTPFYQPIRNEDQFSLTNTESPFAKGQNLSGAACQQFQFPNYQSSSFLRASSNVPETTGSSKFSRSSHLNQAMYKPPEPTVWRPYQDLTCN